MPIELAEGLENLAEIANTASDLVRDTSQDNLGSEAAPDDPNLVKTQVEADLLRENLEEQKIKNS